MSCSCGSKKCPAASVFLIPRQHPERLFAVLKAPFYMFSLNNLNHLCSIWQKTFNSTRHNSEGPVPQIRTSSSGQGSAVRLHLKEKGHTEDGDVHILSREERWFERRKLEHPSVVYDTTCQTPFSSRLMTYLSENEDLIIRIIIKIVCLYSTLQHLQSANTDGWNRSNIRTQHE